MASCLHPGKARPCSSSPCAPTAGRALRRVGWDHRPCLTFPTRGWRNCACVHREKGRRLRGLVRGTQGWGRLLCDTRHRRAHSLTPGLHVGHADHPALTGFCTGAALPPRDSSCSPALTSTRLWLICSISVSKYVSLPERPAAAHLNRLLIIRVAHTLMGPSKLQALLQGVYLILKQPYR